MRVFEHPRAIFLAHAMFPRSRTALFRPFPTAVARDERASRARRLRAASCRIVNCLLIC